MVKQLSFRIPDSTYRQLRIKLATEGRSQVEVFKELVEGYVKTPPKPAKEGSKR